MFVSLWVVTNTWTFQCYGLYYWPSGLSKPLGKGSIERSEPELTGALQLVCKTSGEKIDPNQITVSFPNQF